MSQAVILEVKDGVAIVKLNEPKVRNALTPALRESFCTIICDLEFNEEVRCVVDYWCWGRISSPGGDIVP